MAVGGSAGVRSIVDRVCARPDVLEACRKHEPQQHGGELRGGRPDPHGMISVRDSRHPDGGALSFSPDKCQAFVAKVQAMAADS